MYNPSCSSTKQICSVGGALPQKFYIPVTKSTVVFPINDVRIIKCGWILDFISNFLDVDGFLGLYVHGVKYNMFKCYFIKCPKMSQK